MLRDRIYELRAQQGTVQYRMLYFFHGGQGVLSHGCTKEEDVPPAEIDRALRNRARFEQNPQIHTYEE